MPRKHRQSKPVGPFDLRNTKLPFGSEIDALSAGFARERAGRQGYTEAALAANATLLNDTENAYLVVDLEQDGQIGRAMTKKALYTKYQSDIERELPGTTIKKLSHDIRKRMGIPRDQGVDVGLPGEYIFKPNKNAFVTHVKSARKGMKQPTIPTTYTNTEIDALLESLY